MKGQGHYCLHLKQCAWPTHSIPLLYLPFSKSFIRKPQEINDAKQTKIWSSQSEAMGLYHHAWNLWSYPPMLTLQMEYKATLKPSFSSSDGLQMFLPPIRGALWEMCMRDCFVDLLLVTKTLERRLKLVLGKQTGHTCKHLFNRKTVLFKDMGIMSFLLRQSRFLFVSTPLFFFFLL